MEEEATEIVKLKDLSGALWDEDKSMIVLDHEHYTNHVKAHPEDEQYLNKTIIHYKEMMYIAGGSMAIGQYAKDSSDPLSTEVVNLEEETVGDLGTGVPRLACLRPTAWLHQRPCTTHLHQQTHKTLARGQVSRGGRHKAFSGRPHQAGSRGAERSRQGTPREVLVTQAMTTGARRAPACSVLVSSLVLKRQAQARSPEASDKGFHIGATRPRPAGR
ncbi:hypothetical protein VPH35_059802 [Triticum aestivum]